MLHDEKYFKLGWRVIELSFSLKKGYLVYFDSNKELFKLYDPNIALSKSSLRFLLRCYKHGVYYPK